MDQVRKALGWLKQHHFWVLCVLVALIGVVCWFSGKGWMSKQYADSESKIKSGFSTVDQVLSDPFHPNDDIKTRQIAEMTKLSAEVEELWSQLYERQREQVLIWPSGPGELNTEFVNTVEKLEFGQDIPDKQCEHYQTYIARHFPKLPEKIGARPIDEASAAGGTSGFSRRGSFSPEGGGGFMGAGELEDDGNYICQWAEENQALVRDELEFPQTPSALRIWCTQENLWVYHALLTVIKNTNDAANATRISNAAVRGVLALEVGQEAAGYSRTPNRIYKLPGGTPAAGEGVPGTEMPGGAVGPEGPSREFGGGAPMEFRSGLADGGQTELSPEQERAILLSHRYLGEDGKPIVVAGAAAVEGAEPVPFDPSVPVPPLDVTQFGKEYKRLPVRMVLEMDQRHLPRLIAECANRSLQIEVQEVRINAPDLLQGGAGSGSYGRSFGGGSGGGPEMMSRDFGSELQEFNPRPEIVTVGIQGVIYIFTKPNEELLKPTTEGTADGTIAQVPQ